MPHHGAHEGCCGVATCRNRDSSIRDKTVTVEYLWIYVPQRIVQCHIRSRGRELRTPAQADTNKHDVRKTSLSIDASLGFELEVCGSRGEKGSTTARTFPLDKPVRVLSGGKRGQIYLCRDHFCPFLKNLSIC